MLADWLPERGRVLEIASGTGEHAVFFAERFPDLVWQPSDADADALASIAAWRDAAGLPNLQPPIFIDASAAHGSVDAADAILSINMVHISPWNSALGLVNRAARLLGPGAPLILYGPWIRDDRPTAPSNLAFDADLRRRNDAWGLRRLGDFVVEAQKHDFELVELREMPANNLMLLFSRK